MVPLRDGTAADLVFGAARTLDAPMRIALSICLLCAAAPAIAADTAVPEPSSFALFGLGVLGVIVGRQASRRGKSD